MVKAQAQAGQLTGINGFIVILTWSTWATTLLQEPTVYHGAVAGDRRARTV
jgi:hypothetical protein